VNGWLLAIGALILAALWLGPLPELARSAFSAHMALHMGVVAIAAPLIVAGCAGSRIDPAIRRPVLLAPVAAAVFELLVVWGWHAPLLHHAARASTRVLIAEQGSFLAAGLWLWWSVCGGNAAIRMSRAWLGVAALLFTSVHMTLLGALFALAPRVLFSGHEEPAALADQHLGGGIMLLVGGVSYLAGALWLAVHGLQQQPAPRGVT
jgi:putative membrane protein